MLHLSKIMFVLFIVLAFETKVLKAEEKKGVKKLEVTQVKMGPGEASNLMRVLNFINGENQPQSGTVICDSQVTYNYNHAWYAKNIYMAKFNQIRIDQTGQVLQFDSSEKCILFWNAISDSKLKTTFTYSPEGKILRVIMEEKKGASR